MTHQSGEIVFLNELYNNYGGNVIGKYVRVTGHVSWLDAAQRRCQITYDKFVLFVDLENVDMAALTLDTLVQFIGEIRQIEGVSPSAQLELKANVIRIVNGLDMRLFKEAILARREFLLQQG